jgi:hypothetical protein
MDFPKKVLRNFLAEVAENQTFRDLVASERLQANTSAFPRTYAQFHQVLISR